MHDAPEPALTFAFTLIACNVQIFRNTIEI